MLSFPKYGSGSYTGNFTEFPAWKSKAAKSVIAAKSAESISFLMIVKKKYIISLVCSTNIVAGIE